MKITLVLIASLTFAFGGVPKDRYDPCAFFGICNDGKTTKATTKAPTTMAPATPAPTTGSPDLAKIKVELVSKKHFHHKNFKKFY